MSDWFVRPDVVTLPLSEGHSLTVKKRLNAGEQRAALARLYIAGADGSMKVNPIVLGLTMISAYLIDWTIPDADGHTVEIRGQAPELVEATLDALDPDRFEEIHTAIAAHELAQAAARAEEKKNPHWRVGVALDLKIARRCGWRVEWVRELDPDIYDVLIEELIAEQR